MEENASFAYYGARRAGVPSLIAGLITKGGHSWDRGRQSLTLIDQDGQQLIYEHRRGILRLESSTKTAELHKDIKHALHLMLLERLPSDINQIVNAFDCVFAANELAAQ